MKKVLSSLALALVVPLVSNPMFTEAINGCEDPSYTFAVGVDSEQNHAAAKFAKSEFCRVADTAAKNAA